ncbi:hypothetical protein CAOG_03228 [Capsaspora owczarzaki ATCC 30864]|nr:hypothetical protein CAOG_03228 [Capsaspora owczarzaki ATCC 30864]|eukprot:XP_004364067.1 hypothetical protein CAOG_03228 [Capsaspora owczarzaki ATCC 30864]
MSTSSMAGDDELLDVTALPKTWTVLQIAVLPVVDRLAVVLVRDGTSQLFLCDNGGDTLEKHTQELHRILKGTRASMSMPMNTDSELREWHEVRKQFDAGLADLVQGLDAMLCSTKSPKLKSRPLGELLDRKVADQHTILILGRESHALPWESAPCLKATNCSRVPCMQFLLHRVAMQQQEASFPIDPTRGFYIVNPSGDLKRTQDTFSPKMTAVASWSGLIGTTPVETVAQGMTDAFARDDLVLYLGHGGSERFVPSERLRRVESHAATLLIGCSSGLLKCPGVFEPHGRALEHLLTGCPAVVANLFDVSDREIDKFTETLLAEFLSGSSELSRAVRTARGACRFGYLNGAAPVVYGLPTITTCAVPGFVPQSDGDALVDDMFKLSLDRSSACLPPPTLARSTTGRAKMKYSASTTEPAVEAAPAPAAVSVAVPAAKARKGAKASGSAPSTDLAPVPAPALEAPVEIVRPALKKSVSESTVLSRMPKRKADAKPSAVVEILDDDPAPVSEPTVLSRVPRRKADAKPAAIVVEILDNDPAPSSTSDMQTEPVPPTLTRTRSRAPAQSASASRRV